MNTFAKIKNYLENNESATVSQLSHDLNLTKADIHYHIRILLNNGEIAVLPDFYQAGAGRPARQFVRLRSAPDALARFLIDHLINLHLQNKDQQSSRELLAEYLSKCLLEQCQHIEVQHASPAIRLAKMVKNLSTYGIHLRWLAGKDGPMVSLEKEELSTLIDDPVLVEAIVRDLLLRIQKMFIK